MQLQLDESQRQLERTVAGFLARHYDFTKRRDGLARGDGERQLWRRAADELGLMGLVVPTEHGGHGGGATEAMIVMEALGRLLAFDAFAEHCIVAPSVLRRTGALDLLADIARGEARIGLGFADAGFQTRSPAPLAGRNGGAYKLDGRIDMVLGGPDASHLLAQVDIEGAPALFLLAARADGVTHADYRMVDARAASDFTLKGVEGAHLVAAGEEARALLRRAHIEGMAAACAESLGVLREMLDLTVAFVSQRRQFGAPLGALQAVQHRIADMALALETADAMTFRATLALEGNWDEAENTVLAAKVAVSEALRFVGQSAVQLHGATGTAEESPISHYFRRATVLAGKFGSAAQNLERYAEVFASESDR